MMSRLPQHSIVIFVGIILLWTQVIDMPCGAQTRKQERSTGSEGRVPSEEEETDIIERAITMICKERVHDPQGSIPIDEMAAQRSLPLTDSRVVLGAARAQRLLPIAKRLVPLALSRLATANNSETMSPAWITSRLQTINSIKVEIEERDNAAVRSSEPRAIIFGTIFLAGLRSDEAMIAVLAHELTHVIDGPEHTLQPLFMRVGVRASQAGRVQVQGGAAKELTCELVGIRVMQEYSFKVPSKESMRRRLARALEKNCVREDLADETHLSPRETLQALLILEPELTKVIAGAAKRGRTKKKTKPLCTESA